MLLDVVEGMLSYVGHPQVRVLPHGTLVSLQLPSEQLDHCGLAGTVGPNHSHPRVEGDRNANALNDLAGCVGVAASHQGGYVQTWVTLQSSCVAQGRYTEAAVTSGRGTTAGTQAGDSRKLLHRGLSLCTASEQCYKQPPNLR